jgi:hypothetical protein
LSATIILSGSPFGFSDTPPIGSFIAGAFEEIAFDKSLYHMDRMGVFVDPILLDTTHDAAKDMTGEMGNTYLG